MKFSNKNPLIFFKIIGRSSLNNVFRNKSIRWEIRRKRRSLSTGDQPNVDFSIRSETVATLAMNVVVKAITVVKLTSCFSCQQLSLYRHKFSWSAISDAVNQQLNDHLIGFQATVSLCAAWSAA